jgi:hypothetical protein
MSPLPPHRLLLTQPPAGPLHCLCPSPHAAARSPRRLFVTTHTLTSRGVIVGQGMFALREINQIEREMCSYLEWQLNVDPTMLCRRLCDFQTRVQLGPGPYPMILSQPAPAPFSHQSTGNNINSSTGSAFSSRVPLSKDVPIIPSPSVRTYPSSPPIPQRPPTRLRPLPRHWFCRKRRPMLTGRDSSRLYRQIRARSRLLSSLTATDHLC